MEEELEKEFKEWILQYARNKTAKEMVEDDRFVSRLLIDVQHGRSKSFNKDSRKNSSVVGGLGLLRQEFDEWKNEKEVNDE